MVKPYCFGFIIIIMLFFLSAPIVWADITTTITLRDYLILSHFIDDEIDPDDNDCDLIGATNIALGRLGFKSKGNNNVKAELQVDIHVQQVVVMDVPRAYVKVRFPGFRAMIGKNRVSWGEGFFFNAGDVIFGGMSLMSNLTESVLRDETDILAEIYIPLGRFSFIEGVFLPTSKSSSTSLYNFDISNSQIGGRIVTKAWTTKLEAGYLYRGEGLVIAAVLPPYEEILDLNHFPYLSIQGHLLVDLQLSASCGIPQKEPEIEDIKDSLAISCGLFHTTTFEDNTSFSFRLEAGINPFLAWEENEDYIVLPSTLYLDPINNDQSYNFVISKLEPNVANVVSVSNRLYGLYLYPEIVYSLDQTKSLQLRSIISPIDLSGIIFGNFAWNIYQGFNLNFMLTGMFGDSNDHFGWDRDRDLSFILGMEYKYGG